MIKSIFFFLVVTFSAAHAGGVACAKRCIGVSDFQGCCLACEETCPMCAPCSTHIGTTCPINELSGGCSGKPVLSQCVTYGPHGGKMNGECRLHEDVHRCGCFPLFGQ